MRNKRMFSREIIETDKFADMQALTQVLYIRLGLCADDAGVVVGYKGIMRSCGATQDNYNELVQNGYIIPFDDAGVVVIAHWYINNTLRSDRITETIHREVIEKLTLKDRIYCLLSDGIPSGIHDGIPSGIHDGIPKEREEKEREEKERKGGGKTATTAPEPLQTYGHYNRVEMPAKEYTALIDDFGENKVAEYIAKADIVGENRGRDITNAHLFIRRMLSEDMRPEDITKARERQETSGDLAEIERLYMAEVTPGG